jgi:two-component system cell cycle sensor histidine kinase/response regulator CckA
VRIEVLDMNVIVGEMEDLLRRTIGENVDDLRTELASDLPMVSADRGQIEQLIINLAVNARDAMPDGGELAIETAIFQADDQFASLREIQPGTYVQLKVSDTGVGMTQEVTDRAFDPFFTTKPKGQGTGLGLATVYGIVVQAGGHIAIYSEPGLGTTVRVYLPATSEVQAAPGTEELDVALSAKGETVLLIEDEDIVREPARRMLERHGYTVYAAADAEEGLAIVRAHPGTVDLLLTDVVMAGRSGRELAEDMVELRTTTKVLFMSGYSQDVMVQQAVLDEDVNLIEKPFSSEDLLRRVRDALDHASR